VLSRLGQDGLKVNNIKPFSCPHSVVEWSCSCGVGGSNAGCTRGSHFFLKLECINSIPIKPLRFVVKMGNW